MFQLLISFDLLLEDVSVVVVNVLVLLVPF